MSDIENQTIKATEVLTNPTSWIEGFEVEFVEYLSDDPKLRNGTS